MKEPPYLGKSHPNTNMIWNGIDPNNNSGKQRFSHLDRPTKYQYLTRIPILIPMQSHMYPTNTSCKLVSTSCEFNEELVGQLPMCWAIGSDNDYVPRVILLI